MQDWGCARDTAFIAQVTDNCPIGAAWFRFYTQENHSYGFYNEETPEIAIAVEKEYRKKGIGTALLNVLIAEARKQNIESLSLSVDKKNHAVHMYKKQVLKA